MLPVQYAYWSALLCALLVNAVLSSSAAAQDMDCPDFQYQEDAQEYFESKGGSLWFNADLLDEDGDGIACELNPHRPPWPTPVPTSVPTRVPAPTAISTTVPSQTPNSNQLSDLEDLLPDSNEVPPGLILCTTGSRSLAEVAANYTNPAETQQLLITWGWQENVIQQCDVASPSALPLDSTHSLYISLHLFGSAGSAAGALNYSFSDQLDSTGAEEFQVEAIGDLTKAMSIISTDNNEITLYAQKGAILVRLTAMSPSGDPLPDLVGVAQRTLSDVPELPRNR